jgi:hypothetical protein
VSFPVRIRRHWRPASPPSLSVRRSSPFAVFGQRAQIVALLTPRAVAIVLAHSPPPCMRMLGHAEASMTLDTSADPFDEDLDKVADASEQSIWRDTAGTGLTYGLPASA